MTIDEVAFTKFEAAGWDSKAVGYNDFFGPVTSRLVDLLLDAVDARPGARVLDVATGPGYAAARGADRGATVVGIDISKGMVSLAARLHPELDFRVGNAEALEFPDSEFDAVVGNFALLHLARPEKAVAEFFRVLVPGGRLALTVWDIPERSRLLGVLLDAVAEVGAEQPEGLPAGPPFFRFSDDEEFMRLLRHQRMEAVQVETVTFSQVVSSADELWKGMVTATLRASALVTGQREDVQRMIREAFDRLVRPYRSGKGLELPVAVKLASATRPLNGAG